MTSMVADAVARPPSGFAVPGRPPFFLLDRTRRRNDGGRTMRAINGKRVVEMDGTAVAAWAAGRRGVTIDLGAGDGRFARELARRRPEEGAIAVDLAAANMRDASRRAGGNALFVVADALALPDALAGVATRVTIQFPWGACCGACSAATPG
jgi:tRNA G46 methylase TrmB